MPNLEEGPNISEILFRRVIGGFTLLISGFLLLTISFMETADVIARYFFLSPIPGTLEIIRIMMPFVCFCAFAYAFLQGTHVRVSLITSRLPSRLGRINEFVANIISLVGLGIIVYGSWLYFQESLRIKEIMASGADFWIPLWLGKFGLPFGTTMFLIVFLYTFIRLIVNKK